MAPKRGGSSSGGGSGSGSSSASCPSPFSGDGLSIINTPIPYFVSYCLFFLVTLGILIAWFKVKKHHPNARKLVGGIFGLSVFCELIYYAIVITATMLEECKTLDMLDYYNFAIAYNIFDRLSSILLLVVVFYGLNNLLRSQLGTTPSYVKGLYGAVLGVMGVLTAVVIGLQSYNYWTNTPQGWDTGTYLYSAIKVNMAYWILYLLSVLGAGALAMMAIISMRSRHLATNDLTMWIIGLTFSMFIWVLFVVVETGTSLANDFLGERVYEAFAFIIDIFLSLSWILLLLIAKSPVFKPAADNMDPQIYNQPAYSAAPQQNYVPQPPPQQQYAYNQGNGMPQQQYYNQQPQQQQGPVYYGNPSPVYGNGNMAQVK